MRDRLYQHDTTLRDGQQTQGVQFSTAEKAPLAAALDELGVDCCDGGWPEAKSAKRTSSDVQRSFVGSWTLPPFVNKSLLEIGNPLKNNDQKNVPARDLAPKAQP